jgi:hypothetical protein
MSSDLVAMQPARNSIHGDQEKAANLQRRVFLVLGCAVVLYALLAALQTLWDFDLPWELATGRWIVQHHSIPSVDVFSYTALGRPWIYPVGSGLIFYLTFLLGGYSLLSWLGALTCAGTVAILLRRGNPLTPALALLAVPEMAARTNARADMFTIVLFAAFLSLLWEQHETGSARLWLMPLLMIAWVNLHLGFTSGLALMGAYVLVEGLDLLLRERRAAAWTRLRQASPWIFASGFATLINPWGWNVYRAIHRQQAVLGAHSQLILEWAPVQLTRDLFSRAFLLRSPMDAFFLLVGIGIIAAVAALWKGKLGAAVLLGTAIYLGLQHIRFLPVFSEIVVVIGGAVLGPEVLSLWAKVRNVRLRSGIAWATGCLLLILVGVRSFDVVTNHFALAGHNLSWFGGGLSWWYPEGAAAFILREHVPGQIFNVYDEGGFLIWQLGPKYPDYIDGRAIPFGVELFRHDLALTTTPPDSDVWQEEADRYGINAMIVPLGRYDGLQQFPLLREYCNSNRWVPVYLDEGGAVFLRRSWQTDDLIRRTRIDCDTAPLPATTPQGSAAKRFNQWANAAALLQALGRNAEALTATGNAIAIFNGDAYMHFLRASLLAESGDLRDAEQQYLTATRLANHAATWSALAALYEREGRTEDARLARERASAIQ